VRVHVGAQKLGSPFIFSLGLLSVVAALGCCCCFAMKFLAWTMTRSRVESHQSSDEEEEDDSRYITPMRRESPLVLLKEEEEGDSDTSLTVPSSSSQDLTDETSSSLSTSDTRTSLRHRSPLDKLSPLSPRCLVETLPREPVRRISSSSITGTREVIATQFRQEQDDRETLSYRKDVAIFSTVLSTLLLVSMLSYCYIPAPHVGRIRPIRKRQRNLQALPAWEAKEMRQYVARHVSSTPAITVVLRGHHIDLVYRALDVYATCDVVHQIHVDWNKNTTTASFDAYAKVRPINIANRGIDTAAVLVVHEFLQPPLSCADLERVYNEWTNEPTRSVGFDPAWLPAAPSKQSKDAELPLPSYALMSDRAIMVHRYYLPEVFAPRSMDVYCQEFVLSAKVALLSQASPVAMTLERPKADTDAIRNRNYECYNKVLKSLQVAKLPTATAVYAGRPNFEVD
jgi:hypothetical protein